MMRGTLTIAAFASVILFPWPLTALLALIAAAFEPLLPLAAGLFADALYFAPHSMALPFFTLFGAVATVLAFSVRNRLWASSIE